ncbi:unnamed protein product [Caenorhabditis brenneri]
MFEEEVSTYDPLISGLEPEPLDTVFLQLFSGIKHYITPEVKEEEPPELKPVYIRKPRSVENPPLKPQLSLPSFPQSPLGSVNVSTVASPTKNVKTTKTRQFAMLRCCCTEDFVSQFALEHHETKHHSHFFNWFCSECDIRFDTLLQASDHTLLTHGPEQMPVCDDIWEDPMRPPGVLSMHSIANRSTKFVKDFLHSRGKQTVMTAAYYLLARCELQAITTGQVGLVVYNQAKTDLLTTIDALEHEDFISCLKSTFIYGQYIKRVPLENYFGPTTVYKTLTFNNPPNKNILNGQSTPGTRYTFGSKYRVTPYLANQYQSVLKSPAPIRGRNYALQQPPSQNIVRRNMIAPYTLYPVRKNAQ